MSVDERRVLPLAFYQRDVLTVARELLGTILVSTAGGQTVRILVTETEAYHESERGAHTYGGRRTPRTEVMFHGGGKAYVYFVYGMHWQFNVVTGQAGTGEAVLIRAGVPLFSSGRDAFGMGDDSRQVVRARRGWTDKAPPKDVARWLDGPGKLTQGLGIGRQHNGLEFDGRGELWFEPGLPAPDEQVTTGPRVGIAYAKEDALLPWRFVFRPVLLPTG